MAEELVLVDGGRTGYEIVIPEQGGSHEAFAAAELQRYLHEATGVTLPVVRAGGPPPAAGKIAVMLHEHAPALPGDGRDVLGDEGFLMRTVGQDLYLVGARGRSVLYAVYRFLEDYAGVRFYCFDDERIPQLDRLRIGSIDRIEKPAFPYRGFKGFEPEGIQWQWMTKVGMNYTQFGLKSFERHPERYTEYLAAKAKWDIILDMGGHYMTRALLPPEKYFKDHPDWYSLILDEAKAEAPGENYFTESYEMKAGDRKPEQICSASTGAVAEITGNFIKLVRQYPGIDVFSPWYGDGLTYCQCPPCLEKDNWRWLDAHPACQHWAKPAWVIGSKQLLQALNPMAEAMAREFPDKKLFTIAYVNTGPAPREITPHPNLNIQFATWHRCYSRPLDGRGDAECHDVNEYLDGNLKRWLELCRGDVIIYYYACAKSGMDGRMMPFPRMIAGDVKHFREIGVKGVLAQHVWPWAFNLNAYTLAKMLWNPERDADAILDEYCARYGAAAGDMQRYFSLMEKAMGGLHHPDGLGDNWIGPPVERMARMEKFYPRLGSAEKALAAACRKELSERESLLMRREKAVFTWTKRTFDVLHEYARARICMEEGDRDQAQALLRKITDMTEALRRDSKKLEIHQNISHKAYTWCPKDLAARLAAGAATAGGAAQ